MTYKWYIIAFRELLEEVTLQTKIINKKIIKMRLLSTILVFDWFIVKIISLKRKNSFEKEVKAQTKTTT